MTEFTYGDVFFTLVVGAIIWGILALVHKSSAAADSSKGKALEDDDSIRSLLTKAHSVAVVGASSNPDRPSYHITAYLIQEGYKVYPINPTETSLLDQPCYPTLAAIGHSVDIVDVFRRPEHVPDVARQAVAAGAKTLWLQEGVVNDEGRRIALNGGLGVVMDRCILKEHKRLLGR